MFTGKISFPSFQTLSEEKNLQKAVVQIMPKHTLQANNVVLIPVWKKKIRTFYLLIFLFS